MTSNPEVIQGQKTRGKLELKPSLATPPTAGGRRPAQKPQVRHELQVTDSKPLKISNLADHKELFAERSMAYRGLSQNQRLTDVLLRGFSERVEGVSREGQSVLRQSGLLPCDVITTPASRRPE